MITSRWGGGASDNIKMGGGGGGSDNIKMEGGGGQ